MSIRLTVAFNITVMSKVSTLRNTFVLQNENMRHVDIQGNNWD